MDPSYTNPFANGGTAGQVPVPMPNNTPVTGDIVLGGEKKENKSNKKWIVLGGGIFLVLLIILMLILFINSRNDNGEKNDDGVVGEINLNYIFDKTSPIPVEFNEKYGYINPLSGEMVIDSRYQSAGRFYGDYALVTYTENDIEKTAIINRHGEKVLIQNDYVMNSAYYDEDNNIWIANGNIYDGRMNKINKEDTRVDYIGHGYLLNAVYDNSEQKNKKDLEEGTSVATVSYNNYFISDIAGDEVYRCDGNCTAITTVDTNGNVYAVVNNWGKGSLIVDLKNSKVIYTSNNKNIITIVDDGVFSERIENSTKYLRVLDGEIKVEKNYTPTQDRTSLSESGEYYVIKCENNFYSIKDKNDKIVVGCEIAGYSELPKNVFRYYQMKNDMNVVFIDFGDKVVLYDLKSMKEINNIGVVDVTVYGDSPFVAIYDYASNKKRVCDIFNGFEKCLVLDDDAYKVDGYSNYFIVQNSTLQKFYNYKMENIK